MEAKELMIGDWVSYNPNVFIEDEYEPTKVCYPTKISSGEDLDLAVEGCYAPILLTPEILEKNDFYYGYTSSEEDLASNTIASLSEDGKGWCWDEGSGAIKVIFPNESDGGMLVVDDQSFDRYLQFVYVSTIYVHELQHIMRLCGIEKEIIL